MKRSIAIGQLVYLRPLEEKDAAALVGWFADDEVAGTLQRWSPSGSSARSRYLEEVARSEEDVMLGICTRDGDQLVGMAGLHTFDPQGHSAQFAVVVGDKAQWGKGYGTEATTLVLGLGFETMGLDRIGLEVLHQNERGIRAYEKAGFRREASSRTADALAMSIGREEWKSRRPRTASPAQH
ncbi:MAG: GNAT family protein [Myxococcales bacterium]